jgi:hypothetical protein
MQVKHGDHEIEFTRIIKPNLKRIYISINSANEVIVKTPKMSESDVIKLVRMKASWILKKQAIVKESLDDFEFKSGSSLWYMGQRHSLRLEEDQAAGVGKAWLRFDNSEFILRYNPYLIKEEYMQKALDEFYCEKAKECMAALACKWAEIMGLSYSKITFKKVRRRWGSCSLGGNIMFNYEAIKLPAECCEYLVVHELAHLVHHNHGRDFWQLVGSYVPDFMDRREKMRRFGLS